jgi:putative ABC transport system substrate-binding protein
MDTDALSALLSPLARSRAAQQGVRVHTRTSGAKEQLNTRRQMLLAGLCALLPAPRVIAQKPRVWRIGVLETTSMSLNVANFDALRKGLRALGYIEGQNLIFDYRSAEGRGERFAALASELVNSKVDLIVTRGTPALLAASKATTTIPIVMAAIGETPGQGIVATLARPGGNVTGLSAFVTELTGKRIEVLREVVPKLSRIATLLDLGNPIFVAQWKETQVAAQSMGMQAQLLNVRKADELEPAFLQAAKQHCDGLIVGIDALTQANRKFIAELCVKHRLPAVYASKEFADAGGLLSYGVSYPDLYYRAAGMVHKIFLGAKPGALPVEQPTKYELVINRKTAASLRLTIPAALLLRADEVIS